MDSDIAVVTGAFSYTGSAVARSLMTRGLEVRTLTNRAAPVNDPGGLVETRPLRFDDPAGLAAAMRGARVFVNTYWVRYPYAGVSFERAVANTALLFAAAKEAGVRRIVHVSVSNPSLDSPLAYYRGKALVEHLLRGLGVSHAVVRPTLVVGPNDILVNNIAWFLRRFPVFAMPGSGRYRVQPVTLADVGEIVAEAAAAGPDMTIDAAGPEVMTFEDLVREVAMATASAARFVHAPPRLALALLGLAGRLMGDVVLSREELQGLMSDLLVSRGPPRGAESVRGWLREHGDGLGRAYASEAGRHGRRR